MFVSVVLYGVCFIGDDHILARLNVQKECFVLLLLMNECISRFLSLSKSHSLQSPRRMSRALFVLHALLIAIAMEI